MDARCVSAALLCLGADYKYSHSGSSLQVATRGEYCLVAYSAAGPSLAPLPGYLAVSIFVSCRPLHLTYQRPPAEVVYCYQTQIMVTSKSGPHEPEEETTPSKTPGILEKASIIDVRAEYWKPNHTGHFFMHMHRSSTCMQYIDPF